MEEGVVSDFWNKCLKLFFCVAVAIGTVNQFFIGLSENSLSWLQTKFNTVASENSGKYSKNTEKWSEHIINLLNYWHDFPQTFSNPIPCETGEDSI